MSAIPICVHPAPSLLSWACKSCATSNAPVRVVAAGTSVACANCGAFNSIAPTAPVQMVDGSACAPVTVPAAAGSSHVPVVTTPAPLSLEDDAVIKRFQTFLRFKTVAHQGHLNGANAEAVAFLKSIGESMGLRSSVHTYNEGMPVLVLTLPGSDPSLSSLLLNSHYDVVPVMRSEWSVDPFAADLNADGNILARGTQDMKSVCMQYLEALLRILRGPNRVTNFRRTVHLSFQPDEETGGEWGMQQWVESPEFAALNVGFALDEGIANPGDEFTVFYGERGVWWMTVKAEGPTGHASRFIKNTATQKLMRSVQHFLDYRDLQEAKLLKAQANHPAECGHALSKKMELGDVITLNLTVLKAGVSVDKGETYSMNVIPMEAEAGFDLRLPPHVDLAEFEAMVKEWTAEEGMSYTVRKFSAEHVTNLNEEKNPFWRTFQSTLKGCCGSTKVAPQIFPAGTDSRFLRRALIPCIGFSPLRHTPVLLHDHNEFVSARVFLDGVGVYEHLIPALANLAEVTRNEDGVYKQEKQPLERLKGQEKGAQLQQTEASASSASASQTDSLRASPIPTQTDAPSASAAEPIPTQTDAPAAGQAAETQTQRRPSVSAETQTDAAAAATQTS